jgi:hypothetical protein
MNPKRGGDEVRRSGRRPPKPDSRLPRWTVALILAGGVLTYLGVGSLLLGNRFGSDFESLFLVSGGFAQGSVETIAPFVLLLIPAVLGALWTRETCRVIFRGIRRGDPAPTIAKEVALFALSSLVLVLAGLYSSSRPTD